VPYWVEIHDPVLLNLASKIALFEGCDLAHVLLHPGARNLAGIDWERAKRGDHREIIERGGSGIRGLLNDVPLEGLIFHSQAAREFALRDWPDLDPSRAHVLFHPVFDKLEDPKPKAIGSHLRIGSFGVPGTHKETDRVVRAFRVIRASHPETTLLLAGYDAGRYARNEGIAYEPGIIIEDSPTTERLMDLMRGVDIAVQLRAGNTGESSGIVPQLLSLNRIVVASAVGALVDFGEAVRYVQPGCPPTDLANIILDEVENYERRVESRSCYVVAHSPARFCEELLRIIGTGSAIEDAKAYDLEGLMPTVANPSVPQDGHQIVGGAALSPAPDCLDPAPALWPDFEQLMRETGVVDDPYIQTHIRRYRHTLAAIEEIMPPSGGSALEVGTSWLFALLLRTKLGFNRVDVTDFKSDDDRNNIPVDLCYPSFTGRISAFNVSAWPQTTCHACSSLGICFVTHLSPGASS
jgi:glycosyltransferase involved in cell wall biosynthesis